MLISLEGLQLFSPLQKPWTVDLGGAADADHGLADIRARTSRLEESCLSSSFYWSQSAVCLSICLLVRWRHSDLLLQPLSGAFLRLLASSAASLDVNSLSFLPFLTCSWWTSWMVLGSSSGPQGTQLFSLSSTDLCSKSLTLRETSPSGMMFLKYWSIHGLASSVSRWAKVSSRQSSRSL